MPGPAPKTWRDRLPKTTPHRAAHLVSFIRYIPAVLLRINLLAVCCMAYAGTDEDDYTVPATPREKIKFPPLAARIQRTEIALAVLSLVLDPVVSAFYIIFGGRVLTDHYKASRSKLKDLLVYMMAPVNVALFVGWTVCAAYQAQYVPTRGNKDLEECGLGRAAAQCRMVDASWGLAIFTCVDIAAVLVCCAMTLIDLPPDHLARGFRRASST